MSYSLLRNDYSKGSLCGMFARMICLAISESYRFPQGLDSSISYYFDEEICVRKCRGKSSSNYSVEETLRAY